MSSWELAFFFLVFRLIFKKLLQWISFRWGTLKAVEESFVTFSQIVSHNKWGECSIFQIKILSDKNKSFKKFKKSSMTFQRVHYRAVTTAKSNFGR